MNSRRSHPPLAAAATRARRTRTQMRMWREGKKKSLAALALRGSGAARRGALLATTHAFKLYAPTRHPPRSWSPTRVRIPVAISRATPPPPPHRILISTSPPQLVPLLVHHDDDDRPFPFPLPRPFRSGVRPPRGNRPGVAKKGMDDAVIFSTHALMRGTSQWGSHSALL